MAESEGRPAVGSVGWHDLTASNAAELRDFYGAVTGWSAREVDMGDYADYSMVDPASGDERAGICWSRGVNAALPTQWLMYVVVADLAASLAACRDQGGEVVHEPPGSAQGRMAVIRDPAGAVCALWQPAD